MEEYETLRYAHGRPDESSSRGHWVQGRSTATTVLAKLEASGAPDERMLEYLEQAQDSDWSPEGAWTE